MSYALVYTVKNEARLLPDAIRFHRHLGCIQFYVFFDGTTDDLPSLLDGEPDCICRNSVSLNEINDTSEWFSKICEYCTEWFDLRKKLNTYWAALHAKSLGINWIGAIDPDELLTPDIKSNCVSKVSFENLLSSVPSHYGQIKFLNYDNIPNGILAESPFIASDLFLERPSYLLEQVWRYSRAALGLLIKNHDRKGLFKAHYDQYLFKLFMGQAFPRTLIDPILGLEIPGGIFLSYYNGKTFVRTSLLESIRPGIHFWSALHGHSLRTIRRGAILHYDMFDFECFIHKFRQRPASNTVKSLYTRWAITQIATKLSNEQAREFYHKSICIANHGRQNFLLEKKSLVRIPCAKSFFEK